MEFEEGKFVPSIDDDICIKCGKCLQVCPGNDIEFYEGDDFEEWLTGTYIEGYSAYTKNDEVLDIATSGGVVTQLIIELLKIGDYSGAFVLPFKMFKGKPARLELAVNEEEVKTASKSKYIPASVYDIAKTLEKNPESHYIIVGTPCQINGIKKFLSLKKMSDENLLFLGLFCDKTLNFNVLQYFENKFAKDDEKLIRFDYRNKEKDGWPGHPKLYFDSGRELIVDRSERTRIKEYFQLERCLYCLDKLNREADISFGDCYIAGKEYPGRSSIIIRTKKGKKVWNKYSAIFNLERSSVKSIAKSQDISQKRENLDFAKMISKGKRTKKLKKRKREVKLGEEAKFEKIERSISINKLKDYGSFVREGGKMCLGLSNFLLKDLFTRVKKDKKITPPKNVVIFGGGISNKGAQAMTFTVVDQLKRRFPIENISLLSLSNINFDEVEKRRYNFDMLPWRLDIALNILTEKHLIDFEGISFSLEMEKGLRKKITEADLIIDISGYHLSSQMSDDLLWGFLLQFEYLIRIMLAKKFSIPFYILPQSMGPFEYHVAQKALLFPLMSKYLKYPKKIYVRENHGMKEVKKFTTKNVEKERDMVLLNDGYRLENIFNKIPEYDNVKIGKNSVGIIPNNQVMKRGKKEDIYKMYENIVYTLLGAGKKVYILRHSQSDLHICRNIKKLFSDNNDVILMSEDMSAIELEHMIKQFDFVVASRYHSIIHAFKNGVPALVIGWAVKYKELLEDFNQLQYLFEIREEVEKDILLRALNRLLKNHTIEKESIISKLKNLEKNPVFKDIAPSAIKRV